MGYRYEVFLSYRRVSVVQAWLTPFLELFRDWLCEGLAERNYQFAAKTPAARICRDDEIVQAGALWPETLRDAARDSRCCVAVLTPTYFRSEPCLAEFETFRRRGAGLLVPIRFHDCDRYVHAPENPTAFDLSEFTSTARGTARWDVFNDRVKCFAGQVAQAVINAPPYPVEGQFPEGWISREVPVVDARFTVAGRIV